MDVAGQDATEAFEDVGHSDEAREILTNLLVGSLKRQVRVPSYLSGSNTTSNLSSIPHKHPSRGHIIHTEQYRNPTLSNTTQPLTTPK